MDLKKQISATNIIPNLSSSDKPGIIEELTDLLVTNNMVNDKESTLEALWKRENLMSTGLQYGIATPHAKTDCVEKLTVAIGLKKEGVEFNALDKKPSTIFVLILSPSQSRGPHVQFMAEIARLLENEASRTKLLSLNSAQEIHAFFTGQ